jgi:SAM-dependent methyltransferase
MYTKSADIYDQLYHFKDYAAAAAELREVVQTYRPDARTLLDVACSTGRHLEHLRAHYEVQGLDINPGLIDVARRRNPNTPLHVADMIDFRIGQKFDVVACLFASIVYTRTVENLYRAIQSMANHLNPNGIFLVEPWVSPEQYWPNRVVMNIAEQPGRKVVWMYVGKASDNLVTSDVHFLVGTSDGVVHFTEQHQMALFRESDYVAAMNNAGLDVLQVDPKGFFGNGLYVAQLRAT